MAGREEGAMAEIEVSMDVLTSLSKDLKAVGQTVGGARQGLDGVGKAEAGHDELASAIHDFTDKWHYSLDKIGKKADEVGDSVSGAAQGYTQTDQGIADAARGTGQ
jgi:uncharacterized protein YukE